jgi:hypothetical protein
VLALRTHLAGVVGGALGVAVMPPPPSPTFVAPEAWIAQTLTLTLEERGAYATLLAVAGVRGGVPAGLADLAAILRVSRSKTAQILAKLWPHFTLSRDGIWVPFPQTSEIRHASQLTLPSADGASAREFSTGSTGSTGRSRREDPGTCSTSTSTSTGVQRLRYARMARAPVENREPVEKPPASTWKRALALAHAVIETCPEAADRSAEFKRRAVQQRLPWDEPGPRDGRPLFARALDFAQYTRESRRGA